MLNILFLNKDIVLIFPKLYRHIMSINKPISNKNVSKSKKHGT